MAEPRDPFDLELEEMCSQHSPHPLSHSWTPRLSSSPEPEEQSPLPHIGTVPEPVSMPDPLNDFDFIPSPAFERDSTPEPELRPRSPEPPVEIAKESPKKRRKNILERLEKVDPLVNMTTSDRCLAARRAPDSYLMKAKQSPSILKKLPEEVLRNVELWQTKEREAQEERNRLHQWWNRARQERSNMRRNVELEDILPALASYMNTIASTHGDAPTALSASTHSPAVKTVMSSTPKVVWKCPSQHQPQSQAQQSHVPQEEATNGEPQVNQPERKKGIRPPLKRTHATANLGFLADVLEAGNSTVDPSRENGVNEDHSSSPHNEEEAFEFDFSFGLDPVVEVIRCTTPEEEDPTLKLIVQCDKCKNWMLRKYYDEHRALHKPQLKWIKCDMFPCSAMFASFSYLEVHRQWHLDNPFDCRFSTDHGEPCNYKAASMLQLIEHENIAHEFKRNPPVIPIDNQPSADYCPVILSYGSDNDESDEPQYDGYTNSWLTRGVKPKASLEDMDMDEVF